MELLENTRKISFWFFVALGVVHFGAGLLFTQGYLLPYSGLTNRVTFIPFFVAAYTFCASHLLHFIADEGRSRPWITRAVLITGFVLFLLLLGFELFAPDDPTPLIN